MAKIALPAERITHRKPYNYNVNPSVGANSGKRFNDLLYKHFFKALARGGREDFYWRLLLHEGFLANRAIPWDYEL